VKKSPVKTKGIQGNYVVVTEGIAPGDILVVAGVSFLRDGRQVKPMTDSDSNP
jgi:multidrug efflux pump subunit AcrA (membrane-fusion protein)